MSALKNLLRRGLVNSTGNCLAQRLLERNVYWSQYLMGIGSGSGVDESGEKILFSMLKESCTPPLCIFDVGANKGQFLQMALSNLDADKCQIHCFEPCSHAFDILSRNARGNPFVSLHNIGLGKEKGEFNLYYDKPGSGTASLTKRRLDHFGVTISNLEKVAIDTLDNYCSNRDIKSIDLLKIDVEGHELDVLSGAKNMLANNNIGMISFEFGGCNIDTHTFFQEFFYLFKAHDMILYRITPSGYLHPLPHYVETFEQFRTTNYLAIRRT